jgi:predicted TIM-barrel fold metal-dependent hydrolase
MNIFAKWPPLTEKLLWAGVKRNWQTMRDEHIHIGQWHNIYYRPIEIVNTVMEAGIDGLSFSSTTSCVDDIQYIQVEKEIDNLLSHVQWAADVVCPFLWYIPPYIEQGISIGKAFASLPYKGIKLHPVANSWDFDNSKHIEVLNMVFDYASINKIPVMIHTGENGIDSPDRFERFFRLYPDSQIILAHCRPPDLTIEMLAKYASVYCDSSFVPEEWLRRIIDAGFSDRIYFGTDFPITHYWKTQNGSKVYLKEQYTNDIEGNSYSLIKNNRPGSNLNAYSLKCLPMVGRILQRRLFTANAALSKM